MTRKIGVIWFASMVSVLLTLSPAWAQRSSTVRETKADVLKEKLDKGEKGPHH